VVSERIDYDGVGEAGHSCQEATLGRSECWVQDWVQLEKEKWLGSSRKRHQIGHLDFCPPRLLTEGLTVVSTLHAQGVLNPELCGSPNLGLSTDKMPSRSRIRPRGCKSPGSDLEGRSTPQRECRLRSAVALQ